MQCTEPTGPEGRLGPAAAVQGELAVLCACPWGGEEGRGHPGFPVPGNHIVKALDTMLWKRETRHFLSNMGYIRTGALPGCHIRLLLLPPLRSGTANLHRSPFQSYSEFLLIHSHLHCVMLWLQFKVGLQFLS